MVVLLSLLVKKKRSLREYICYCRTSGYPLGKNKKIMPDTPNSSQLNSLAPFSDQPHQSLPREEVKTRNFPEGKVYVFVVIGFFVCENLTNTWLPALGLRTLAHQYENFANFIAPYLLLPVCLILAIRVLRRSLLPGFVAIAGSLMLDWFFFIRYDLLLSRLALAIIGGAVLWSYLLYRSKKEALQAPPPVAKAKRWQIRGVYTSFYVVSFLLAAYAAPLLRHLAGPYGGDLSLATATFPTLVVLVLYLLFQSKNSLFRVL